MKWRVRASDWPTPDRKSGEVPRERQSLLLLWLQSPYPHVVLLQPSPLPFISTLSPSYPQIAPQRKPLAPPTGQQGDWLSEKDIGRPRCCTAGKAGHVAPAEVSPARRWRQGYSPKTFMPSLNSRPFLITTWVSSGASVTVSFNSERTASVALLSSSDGGATRTFFVTVWI